MNGNFYQNPKFPTVEDVNNNFQYEEGYQAGTLADMPMQQSYIENILRNNKGKKVKIYTSFPDSNEWKDKIFVKSDISARTWDFVDLNDEVLFSIVTCNFEDWDETRSDVTEMLMIQNETVYFCKITAAGEEKGITAADLLEYFTLNINSQG
jgi:hypothetical protein